MKKSLLSVIGALDRMISRAYLENFQERSGLSIFLFHGLFADKSEMARNMVNPLQEITTEDFRRFVEYYLRQDYIFISPDDIANGLKENKKYALITFDDGYYSSGRALPVLREYEIPAVFYPSVSHIRDYKGFWWDVVFREGLKSGKSVKSVMQYTDSMKSKTNREIEEHLKTLFGPRSFEPVSDTDRPFTVRELKDFAGEKYVCLGNHTVDHAILTNYSLEEVNAQIKGAQEFIYNLTGIRPVSISYPSGKYSKEIIEVAKANGLKLGITVRPEKNRLPVGQTCEEVFCLKRLCLTGNNNIEKQCEVFRSDIVLYNFIRKVLGI